jgi:hypothetical protein
MSIAKVINLLYVPGAIEPCVGIIRGVDVASRSNGAPFMLNVQLSYLSKGARVRINFSGLVNQTTYIQQLDPMTVQDETRIAAPLPPDSGSTITASSWITIVDPTHNNEVVSMGAAEYSYFTAP